MNIKIYHNPNCSKSRATLELIRNAGIEPQIIEYLQTPPDERTLRELLSQMNFTAQDLVREPERFSGCDNDEVIAAMLREPSLINRPIVVSDKGVRLCRPPELVLELL
ncbi:arsenate reductase (glutaredoxin) [Kingella negevensis]|uniref:arsenate reductase (glutaredoxin) n=1 Tax=Kingella negevensis TaxID=1522312 RepID=UPI00050A258B|nr:arsenate reductase (glutaredoxin) [Kingella negevensis]WII91608.1 arsenate reductase (glutaredoxin) [Kingella negevensis]